MLSTRLQVTGNWALPLLIRQQEMEEQHSGRRRSGHARGSVKPTDAFTNKVHEFRIASEYSSIRKLGRAALALSAWTTRSLQLIAIWRFVLQRKYDGSIGSSTSIAVLDKEGYLRDTYVRILCFTPPMWPSLPPFHYLQSLPKFPKSVLCLESILLIVDILQSLSLCSRGLPTR